MKLEPRIVPLAEAAGIGAGGKAEGLAALIALGYRVPPGFVILDASRGSLPIGLAHAYRALGEGLVAVRSSASDEDGAYVSFAGQHATILDVDSLEVLEAAVVRCLESVDSDHASAYRVARADGAAASMSVVVQRMVDASAAGVVFTADPVSARRDRMVIDVVRGVGEALVSGRKTPDHHLLDAEGNLLVAVRVEAEQVLSDARVARVAREAIGIARAFGRPIDAEFAFDREGTLHWLQARPITALPADPRELDTPADPTHVHTRCNVGEMMPGAATPLTWSTSARGIDYGMQRLYTEVGVTARIDPRPIYILQWFGHLFIDLSAMSAIGGGVAGASEEEVVTAICGRPVPEVGKVPRLSPWRRARNGVRYVGAMLSSERHLTELDRILYGLRFDAGPDVEAIHASIDRALPKLLDAYYHHLAASMSSGAAASALLAALAEGREPNEDDHATVAELLAGAEGVESHDIAVGIDRIVDEVVRAGDRDLVLGSDRDALRPYFERVGPGGVRAMYRAYLARHGHRCVREVEMREREWAEDPSPILDAIVSALRAPRTRRASRERAAKTEVPTRLAPLVALGRRGVRAREAAKSKLVAITARFKGAYRTLAVAMVAEGVLADTDLVHFLTHDELGHACRDRSDRWVALARSRRDVHPIQMAMEFPDVFLGAPEPLRPEPTTGERVLRGKPVSRGVARGRARVARTLEDARAVEPGEILIAPVTDVGWTPCFATIAGLATDIGSAVSHGAVVAREYGLPALVDVRIGTTTFCTGDFVELDADRGLLRAIDRPGAEER